MQKQYRRDFHCLQRRALWLSSLVLFKTERYQDIGLDTYIECYIAIGHLLLNIMGKLAVDTSQCRLPSASKEYKKPLLLGPHYNY